MFTCKWALMRTVKHEEGAIFQRKMSGFRMFEADSEREARRSCGVHQRR